jgi:hypothetical protein
MIDYETGVVTLLQPEALIGRGSSDRLQVTWEEAAVFRVFLTQQHAQPDAEIVTATLQRWIDEPPPSDDELDALTDEFVEAVQEVFPGCCIHFEDWKGTDAIRMLNRYAERRVPPAQSLVVLRNIGSRGDRERVRE